MTNETYKILENYMLSCMDDSAHDKEHIYRVLYNALAIAQTEDNVDYDVLIGSCLLHDIGRKEQFENPALCHALVGSEKAYQFLIENGFDKITGGNYGIRTDWRKTGTQRIKRNTRNAGRLYL